MWLDRNNHKNLKSIEELWYGMHRRAAWAVHNYTYENWCCFTQHTCPLGAHVGATVDLWMKPTMGCPHKTIMEALRSKTIMAPAWDNSQGVKAKLFFAPHDLAYMGSSWVFYGQPAVGYPQNFLLRPKRAKLLCAPRISIHGPHMFFGGFCRLDHRKPI